MIGDQGTPYGEQYPQQPPSQGWPGSAGGFAPFPEPGPAPGSPSPAGPGPGSWGYPPQPPPPRKSNVGLIIAVVVGALVALGLLGTAAVFALSASVSSANPAGTPSGSPLPSTPASTTPTPSEPVHSITLPDSAGGFTRTTGNVTDRLISAMRGGMSKDATSAAALRNAKIGAYTKGNQRIIFFGLSTADSSAFADEMKIHDPSLEVDSMFTGAGITHTDDYPAGPLGGVLRCGQRTAGSVHMSVCTWSDSSAFGSVFGPNMLPRRLAQTALGFRAAAER